MVILPYNDSMAEEWDLFVRDCPAGTMLHTRRFLSYHGDRFRDCSLIIQDEEQRPVALFPAAFSLSEQATVISHPGITYGGLLGAERCRGEFVVQLLRAICDHYAAMGVKRLLYKAVPHFYHRTPAQDDLYALFRLGGRRYRCDLSATIDLQHRGQVGSRRKRGYKKALKAGVQIVKGVEYVAQIWEVLSSNLVKHDAKPVHSVDEIRLLNSRFPEEIEFIAAVIEGRVEAGVVLFKSPMVTHAQYIASSAAGYMVNALDMVFEHCIAAAEAEGRRYFDFGISNENGGLVLNEGLYGFKREFGAGGCVHEFYEIDLVSEYGA